MSNDAQPQKIYTTRQILHPLRERHGDGPETQPFLETHRTDDFLRWAVPLAGNRSIEESELKSTRSMTLVGRKVSQPSEHRAISVPWFSETCGFIVRRAGEIAI